MPASFQNPNQPLNYRGLTQEEELQLTQDEEWERILIGNSLRNLKAFEDATVKPVKGIDNLLETADSFVIEGRPTKKQLEYIVAHAAAKGWECIYVYNDKGKVDAKTAARIQQIIEEKKTPSGISLSDKLAVSTDGSQAKPPFRLRLDEFRRKIEEFNAGQQAANNNGQNRLRMPTGPWANPGGPNGPASP